MPPAESEDKPLDEEELADALKRFNELFPTERDCMEELYKRAEEEDLAKCRYCGKREIERAYGERTIWCKRCKKRTWVTGGTFFHGVRTAKPWLIAIWLTENGVALSSSRFHKIAGIAQSSAWFIFKKITAVIEKQMVGMDVSTGMFVRVFCKRSRETPAREHPKEEQREIERAQKTQRAKYETDQKNAAVQGSSGCELPESIETMMMAQREFFVKKEAELVASMGEEEKIVYEKLTSEPLTTDSLSEKSGMEIKELLVALTMLELSGAVARVSGNRYKKNLPEVEDNGHMKSRVVFEKKIFAGRKGAKTSIEASMRFMRRHFHGISRKYVQHYLAAHRYSLERERRTAGALLTECIRYGRLNYAQILAYVSPALVKI